MSKREIAVFGAAGKMGREVIRQLDEAVDLRMSAAVVRNGSAAMGRDAGEMAGVETKGVFCSPTIGYRCDGAIDFSGPSGMQAALAECRERGIPFVSGSTGLTEADHLALEEASVEIPVMWAPNLSLGVQLCYELVGRAARALGDRADIEIVEMHHRDKRDAPSGTARSLAESAAVEIADTPEITTGRQGVEAPRNGNEIHISSLRGGDVVGDHTVIFSLGGERVEITHRAQTRSLFARGALDAIRFVSKQPPGRYKLADLLA